MPRVHKQSPRWESNPHVRHTKTASCHYITRAYVLYQLVTNKSAQWESNPHVRHGKAIGYRYIMGASYISRSPTVHPAGFAPAKPLWKSGVLLLHHGRTRTSGSGGNRTHVHLLKRQAPNQRRTHFRFALAGSGPHGNRTRTPPLDKRPLYQVSFWTGLRTSRWRRNRTPQDCAVGFGDRVRSQTQSPPNFLCSAPRASAISAARGNTNQYPVRESNPTSAA